MLALGIYGGRVMLVDPATWEVKWEVQAHSVANGEETLVAISGGFVASGGWCEDHWKLWNAASGELRMVGARHDGTGGCICEVQDALSNSVVTNTLFKEGCPVVAHTKGLSAVAFAGGNLATGGLDDTVIVWDAQTGKAEQRMQGDIESPLSLSFSATGKWLASGCVDGDILIWDATTGALLRKIQMRDEEFMATVHFSTSDNHRLASVAGNVIRLWDVISGDMINSFAGRSFVVFSPDGRTIATASRTSNACFVHLVDAESGALQLRIVGNTRVVLCASFSVDDGSKIATGYYDGNCNVWDSSTGALLCTINVGNSVSSVSWGRDWVRDEKCVALAMGHHPRLGAGSQVLELELGVVRMILDRV